MDGGNYGKKKIFIIVENHELLEGIAQQFEKFSNYQIVGTANSAGDAITFLKQTIVIY